MRNQRIRTAAKNVRPGADFKLGGWLEGKASYLWFSLNGECVATLDGQQLYRLAKAIVRRFEEE